MGDSVNNKCCAGFSLKVDIKPDFVEISCGNPRCKIKETPFYLNGKGQDILEAIEKFNANMDEFYEAMAEENQSKRGV